MGISTLFSTKKLLVTPLLSVTAPLRALVASPMIQFAPMASTRKRKSWSIVKGPPHLLFDIPIICYANRLQ